MDLSKVRNYQPVFIEHVLGARYWRYSSGHSKIISGFVEFTVSSENVLRMLLKSPQRGMGDMEYEKWNFRHYY